MLEYKNRIELSDKCWVGLVNSDNFNKSLEDIFAAVTDIGSVVYGRFGVKNDTPENREKIFKRLLIEAANEPSTPFEFCPIVMDLTGTESQNYFLKYGIVCDNKIYTNLRNVLKNELQYDFLENSKLYENFKIISGRLPKYVYNHLVMHRNFSRISETSRNKKYLYNVEFEYPTNWRAYVKDYFTNSHRNKKEQLIRLIEQGTISAEDATKDLPEFRLVNFHIAAWLQDKNGYANLFKQREVQKTQNATKNVCEAIKKLIY